MTHTPAVSVIVPTHNRPDLLAIALRSLAWQTFRDFEVIVVNDAGQDVTDVVRGFEKAFPARLVTHERNKGLSAARNSGIAASKGRYIAYLDDDDFFYERHLEKLYGAVEQTGARVVYSNAIRAVQRPVKDTPGLAKGAALRTECNDGYVTVERSIPYQLPFDRDTLSRQNITPVLTVFHERACLDRVGGFSEYLFAHEDWDLWLRLSRHFDFHHLDEATCEYTMRTDGSSMSMSKKKDMRESWLFTRCCGLYTVTLPPVAELERNAAKARRLTPPPSSTPLFSLIVPISTVDAATPAFFASLCASLGDVAASAELVIAASGVVRDDAEALVASLKHILPFTPTLLYIPRDAGRVFTANRAASTASGEWLVFLEDEVSPRPGWLHALRSAANAAPGLGAVGGVLERPGLSPIFGGEIRGNTAPNFRSSSVEAADLLAPDALSSLCLMTRRECFLGLEGFDPAFAPGHYADADFCLRLRKSGLACRIAPDARLDWNKGGRPLAQSSAGMLSRRAFLDRHAALQLPNLLDGGSDWSKRARPWPSDGRMPESFVMDMPGILAEQA